ncbi:hypothetical protein LCGC14_1560750 [marine sediment metagenome]|uniref:Uncharacterized protein n=1 Tax=marine sediment metagenome TaxID=412755 RepID=A0A0F9L3Z6_9ZZZZ
MNDDLRERLRSALDDHGLPPSPALLEKLVEAALSGPEPAIAGDMTETQWRAWNRGEFPPPEQPAGDATSP